MSVTFGVIRLTNQQINTGYYITSVVFAGDYDVRARILLTRATGDVGLRSERRTDDLR